MAYIKSSFEDEEFNWPDSESLDHFDAELDAKLAKALAIEFMNSKNMHLSDETIVQMCEIVGLDPADYGVDIDDCDDDDDDLDMEEALDGFLFELFCDELPDGTKAPAFAKETKSVLMESDGDLYVWYKDPATGRKCWTCLYPAVKDVIVDDNNSVIVKFADGQATSAEVQGSDKFSIEYGITICLFKKLLIERTNKDCGSLYSKLIDQTMKFYDTKCKNAAKAEAEAKEAEAREAKRAAKRQEKIMAREAEQREKEIEIHKEAYKRALRELQGQ